VSDRVEALSTTQRAIGRLTLRSHQEMPTFYVRVRARVDALVLGLAERRERTGTRVTLNDAVIRAVVVCLESHPNLNATVVPRGEEVTLHDEVRVGVVTATERGLMIPSIPASATTSVGAISSHVSQMRALIASGTLKGAYLAPPTFTVSNLGMFGVEEFTAIIPGKGVAVLALGVASEQPVVEQGSVVIGTVMTMTLTVDHRWVNGVDAARFLGDLKRILEAPPLDFWE